MAALDVEIFSTREAFWGLPVDEAARQSDGAGARRLEARRCGMEHRTLGGTGLKVSRIMLGCGNFGGIGAAPELFGQGESDEEAFALIDAAWDLGINVFDTADAYGGAAARRPSAWLAQQRRGHARPGAAQHQGLQPGRPGPQRPGLSRRRHVRARSIRACARLGGERLDIYLMHEPDPTTPLEETLAALDDLRAQGQGAPRRREQRAGLAPRARALARRPARRGALRVGADGLQPAGSVGRSRSVAGVRRSGVRVHAVLPARGRLADGQVPRWRGDARRVAHDAAPRTLRAPAARRRSSTRSSASSRWPPSGASTWRRWRWRGCLLAAGHPDRGRAAAAGAAGARAGRAGAELSDRASTSSRALPALARGGRMRVRVLTCEDVLAACRCAVHRSHGRGAEASTRPTTSSSRCAQSCGRRKSPGPPRV